MVLGEKVHLARYLLGTAHVPAVKEPQESSVLTSFRTRTSISANRRTVITSVDRGSACRAGKPFVGRLVCEVVLGVHLAQDQGREAKEAGNNYVADADYVSEPADFTKVTDAQFLEWPGFLRFIVDFGPEPNDC